MRENKRELLHSNDFFNIYREQCHYLEYHKNDKGVVGSSMLIFNKDHTKILLIRNYRSAVGFSSWETPRGGAEQGEDHKECAIRESKEETGFNVYNVESAGFVAPETGTMASHHEVFFGIADEYEVPSIVDTDDEIEEVSWKTKEDVINMIKNNEIVCGISLSLIMKGILIKKF